MSWWSPGSSQLRRGLLVAALVCLVVDGALLAKYLADDAILRHAVEVDASLPPSRKVVALLEYIERNVGKRDTTDDSFLPGLSFLRPTARQVLEKGGDCADRSRLLIELLKREGVKASKVALHDSQGNPQHAVVQAEIEDDDGAMVVDALFGIHFPDGRGGYYDVEDIRRNETILEERLHALAPTQPLTRQYPLELYTYQSPRTINWTKSWGLRQLYRILYAVMGPRVDELPRPAITTDPVLMTLCAAVFAQLSGALGVLLLRRGQVRVPVGAR